MEDTNQNVQMTGGESTENSNQNDWNYDPVTGKPYNVQKTYGNQNNVGNIQNENNGDGGQDLCIASVCCFIIGNLLLFTPVAIIAGVVLITGFVTGIIAMEKYPGNQFAKILTGLFIVEVIIVVIFVIYVIYTCMSCLDGGCAGMS